MSLELSGFQGIGYAANLLDPNVHYPRLALRNLEVVGASACICSFISIKRNWIEIQGW